MSKDTPEVGDVWQNKTGRLRLYITKVDVWGIIFIMKELKINIVKYCMMLITLNLM